MSRRTNQRPSLLSEHVLEGYERHVVLGSIPSAKLEEIFQLRFMARELIGHINALELAAKAVALGIEL